MESGNKPLSNLNVLDGNEASTTIEEANGLVIQSNKLHVTQQHYFKASQDHVS